MEYRWAWDTLNTAWAERPVELSTTRPKERVRNRLVYKFLPNLKWFAKPERIDTRLMEPTFEIIVKR